MRLQQAIEKVYGKRLGYIPDDGMFRKFRIDPFRLGFVVSVGECAIFGCRADGIMHTWNPEQLAHIKMPAHDSEKIKFERLVIACAKGLIRRGDVLSAEDGERLDLAVERLDELLWGERR